MSAANTAGNQRGRPFRKGRSGNPAGKPKGARHRATLVAEVLLDGEAEKLTRKAVEMALAGDVIALRLCLDRILPPRRERLAIFPMPPMGSAVDAPTAVAAILAAIAAGALSVGEATELAKLVETFVRCIEAAKDAARKQETERLFSGLNFGGLAGR